MLAGLPKLFEKNFVIGFLLPTILAMIAFAWLLPDLALLEPLRSLEAGDKALSDLTYLVLAVYGIAILLMMTNTAQYRLLEGYLPPLSLWRAGRRRHRLRRQALAAELGRLEERSAAGLLSQTETRRGDEVNLRLVNDYPPLDQDTLPTRFGNAIRAFESYPLEVYGADGPPIWLRLSSVIPASFTAQLEDARAQVNFLLNLLFVLLAFAATALIQAAAMTPWESIGEGVRNGLIEGWRPLPEALAGIGALLVLPILYSFAVNRAKAWGDLVKAGFDCYLPALIKQLGYQSPSLDDARRAFWREFNALIMFRQAMDPANYRIAGAPAPPKDG